MNVARQELRRQGDNSVPRSVKNRVIEYQEEYVDDEADPDEPGDRPGNEEVPSGTGMYLAEFEGDIPRLIHKAAAAFDSRRGRGKFPPFLTTVISNTARDWTKRRTIPGMNGRAAEAPPELNVAETLDREDLGGLYEAADAEVLERVQILTRRRDRTGAAILRGVWAGQSGAQLARKLGISESAVSQRISAIRKLLPHFDEAMGVHRIAIKFVNNDGDLSESDLSFLGNVRNRYRGGNSAQSLNPTHHKLDRRPVKATAKIIYQRWPETAKAPAHCGRTEVLFNSGMGEPIRVGDRHLLNVKFHHRSHLFNADRVGETETEYRARKEFFGAIPTPWKHGDSKCKMIQRKSEDHRPTYRSVNELAWFLEERGDDTGQILEGWKASQLGRFDHTGRQELPEPASDKRQPVYQFACLKPQGHWKMPRPTWGADAATSDVYDRHKKEWSVYSPLRRQGQRLRISTADRLQMVSRYERGLRPWHTPKLEPLAPEFLVRRGKRWHAPHLEPLFAPELVRYDFPVQKKWAVQEIADGQTVSQFKTGWHWIAAPPLQPPEFVDQGSTCARNVTTEYQTE